jgi:hypothetical protein
MSSQFFPPPSFKRTRANCPSTLVPLKTNLSVPFSRPARNACSTAGRDEAPGELNVPSSQIIVVPAP